MSGQTRWIGIDDRPPILNGRWKICYEDRRGEGTHSEVFRAEDLSLGDEERNQPLPAAAVFLRPDVPEAVIERVAQAGWLQAYLDHPRVIKTKDRGITGGTHFLITDLVDHPTLSTWVQGDPKRDVRAAREVTFADAARVGLMVVETLRDIRMQFRDETWGQAIHRDLSPGNVFVVCRRHDDGTFGEVAEIKIGDWIFAIQPRSNGRTGVRGREFAVGTGGYCAPEVWGNQVPTDMSDLYSVGALMYLMLRFEDPPMRLVPGQALSLPEAVPSRLRGFVERLMAREPDERPGYVERSRKENPRAAEEVVAEELAAILAELEGRESASIAATAATPTTTIVPAGPRARRSWAWGLTAAALLAAALVGGGAYLRAHPGIAPGVAHFLGAEPTEDRDVHVFPDAADDDAGGVEPDDPPAPIETSGPVIVAPSGDRAAWGSRLAEIVSSRRGDVARLTLEPLADALSDEGYEDQAAQIRAAADAIGAARGAWTRGERPTPVRYAGGELVEIAGADGASVSGRDRSGAQVTVPFDQVDVGPLLDALDAAAAVRATWATRGAAAAAVRLASEADPIAETWWIVGGALSEAEGELAALEAEIAKRIAAAQPSTKTPIAAPLVGHDLPPESQPFLIDVDPETIRLRTPRAALLVASPAAAAWWDDLVAVDASVETRRASIEAELDGWERFATRRDGELSEERLVRSAAMRAAVARACREREWASRNLLATEFLHWSSPTEAAVEAGLPPPSIERKPRGDGDEVELRAATGAIEIGPEDYARRRRIGYVRVRATLRRTGDEGSVWFLLGADDPAAPRLRVSGMAGGGVVRVHGAGGAESRVEDLFDPERVIEHVLELVAIGPVAVLRVDGRIAHVTPWTDRGEAWPRVGFRFVEGVVSEVREWGEEP